MEFITQGNRIAVENFDKGKLYTLLWKNGTQENLMCISIGADCVVFQGEAPINLFTLSMRNADNIDSIEPTQLGTTNYNNLINKPQINGNDLIGNKTGAQLGLASQSDLEDYATNASVVAGLATKQDSLNSSQLAAVNSGITSSLVTQIGTNENNISLIKHADNTSIYIQETTPTGAIGDYWISSTNGVKVYGRSANQLDYDAFLEEMQPTVPASVAQYVVYHLKPNTAYTLSSNYYSGSTACWFITEPNGSISSATNGVTETNQSRTYTTDSTGDLWVWGRTYASGDAGIISDMTDSDWIMLNEGDSPLPYAPYLSWH